MFFEVKLTVVHTGIRSKMSWHSPQRSCMQFICTVSCPTMHVVCSSKATTWSTFSEQNYKVPASSQDTLLLSTSRRRALFPPARLRNTCSPTTSLSHGASSCPSIALDANVSDAGIRRSQRRKMLTPCTNVALPIARLNTR